MTTKKDFIFTAKTVAAMANREDAKKAAEVFLKYIQDKTHVLTKNDF